MGQVVAATIRGTAGRFDGLHAGQDGESGPRRPRGEPGVRGLSWLALIGTTPPVGTAPTVGPARPHALREAGHTMEPSVSVPTASGVRPAATAVPEPEDVPRAALEGPRVPHEATGGGPSMVERSERMFAHSTGSCFPAAGPGTAQPVLTRAASLAGRPSREVDPAAPGSPATSMLSLTRTGTPCSGPRTSPGTVRGPARPPRRRRRRPAWPRPGGRPHPTGRPRRRYAGGVSRRFRRCAGAVGEPGEESSTSR